MRAMATDVGATFYRCYSAPVSASLSGKAAPFSRSRSRNECRIANLFALGRRIMVPGEISFMGVALQHQKNASGEQDLQRSCGRKVVLNVSCSQSKPPIFVLKKPPRMPISSEGNDRRKTPKLESEEGSEDDEAGLFTVGENHKSGYVALIGKPNVGKSTLLNQIIGQRLSIVTSKPQTTRHRILGICSTPDYQMIIYDTPGVLPKTTRRLDELMMQNVTSARMNADCVLLIADACRDPEKTRETLEGLQIHGTKQPTLLVLNKMDLVKPGEIVKKTEWYLANGDVDEVIPVSAKFGQGVDKLKAWVVQQLPKGPAYYPKGIVSEHSERFFVSEIVREKIFLQYRKEIPYVTQVNVLNYVERKEPAKDFIDVEIVVERDSQMAILVGKDGAALKVLATAARLDIEEFIGKQVYILLKVKVRGAWREDEELLNAYGYNKGMIKA